VKSLKRVFLLLCVALPLFGGQSSRLGTLLSRIYPSVGGDDRLVVLVSFTDKGKPEELQAVSATSLVSERSLRRRLKVRDASNVVDMLDMPVRRAYVDAVRQKVVAVRHELKWFNAVSVVATRSQIDALARLPFVAEIELVARWRVNPDL
jgi:hypothetical protein